MSAASTDGLLVADSFRVRAHPITRAAEVRGLDLHLARFRRSALSRWPGSGGREPAVLRRIDAFLDSALPRIAEYGEGFPRLELRAPATAGDAPVLDVSLRLLPELRDTIALRSAPGTRLAHASIKGPNIARLAELNRELGAEALLLDGDGRVLEGATTSLVWWIDGTDASGHCAPRPRGATEARADGSGRIESVTEALLREAARQRLSPASPDGFSEERIGPAELARHEVWAVNALHGIRPVTSIDGVATPAPEERRLARFREALDRAWRPVI